MSRYTRYTYLVIRYCYVTEQWKVNSMHTSKNKACEAVYRNNLISPIWATIGVKEGDNIESILENYPKPY